MNPKDTALRILIVVGVLYSTLLVVLIIYFSLSISVLSGVRLSYENPFKIETSQNELPNEDQTMPESFPVSY